MRTRSNDSLSIKRKWQKALVLIRKQGLSVENIKLSRKDSSNDIQDLKSAIDKFIDLCSTGRRATVQLDELLNTRREMLEENLRIMDEREIIIKASPSISTEYLDDRFKEIQSDLIVVEERIKELQFSAAETDDTEILNALQQLQKHEAVKLLIQYLDDFIDMKVQWESKLTNLKNYENEIKTLKISVQRYRDIQQPADDLGDFENQLLQMEQDEKKYLRHTLSTQNKIKKVLISPTSSPEIQ